MFLVAICSILNVRNVQAINEGQPKIEQHIQEIIMELPASSSLRHELSNGARGDGVRQAWMDDMRRQDIKRAIVWIDIRFGRHGRPTRMIPKVTQFFSDYAGGTPITDPERLKSIRSSGLGQRLESLASERTAHGVWVDIPHPTPKPFVGGTKVEFFDDEWLPTPRSPIYCAGKSCLTAD